MSYRFTHLHLHTEYSLLDGANKIKELAQKIKEKGMDSVAITDHGNMFGAIDFYTTMKKEGVKPIIGMESYIHNAPNLDDKSTKQRFHLCLYAKNLEGYKNLMYLSSKSYLEGFYYYPRINKELLKAHSKGLICSSACLQGEINWQLNTQNERNKKFGAKGYEEALKVASWYKGVFGDDFYLELMRHGISDQLFIDDLILKVAKELDIKVIATNDTHYPEKENASSHEAFMCVSMNVTVDNPNRLRHSVQEFYLKSPEQMAKIFADVPEILENTQELANKCNLELELGNPTPPNFKFTQEISKEHNLELLQAGLYSFLNDEILFDFMCARGLEKKLVNIDTSLHEAYKQRLERESQIIKKMKFCGYMLIVWDFVRAAKERAIPVGPGRGSAAGSLVAYALEITNIDPIEHGLLFERFLNPERVSMPDIDMDFCQERRGDIIDYVVERYGRNNVAQVITFGSLLAKGVIRDVARVLGMPYAKADMMAKLIPDELKITLKDAYAKEPKIKELIADDEEASRVWDFSLKLEGLKRNAGTHAAGLVISNDELWNKTPLYRPSGTDDVVTQYDGRFLEDVDLIKFDFLGLKTLTVISNAVKLIKEHKGVEIDFDTMKLDDENVFKTIQSGNTLGLFQVESSGMQQLNAKLKPSNFEDLVAVLALYRPGPMDSGMLDDFIDRKHGKQKIDYFYAEFTKPLKPILESTYGIIVYQEQVMQIVQTIGGFSLGKADIVRRAMGKKKKEEMEAYAHEFATGGKENGYNYDHCVKLFDLIEKFAGYGFNKSHSAAYAMITYQTAYLKTYHPCEFMSALLSSEMNRTEKVVSYIDEIKKMGMDLLPPDINKSNQDFTPIYDKEKPTIIFGLGAIKGVGTIVVDLILKSRKKDGEFADLSDFLARNDPSKVNKKSYDSFTKSGAFDSFGYSRATLLSEQEKILEAASNIAKLQKENTNSLFSDDETMMQFNLDLESLDEFDLKTILEYEKETLGLFVSGHPLDEYKAQIEPIKYTLSSEIASLNDGSKVLFVGKILEVKEKFSKKGNKFYIVQLMDFHGTVELMLFPDNMEKIESLGIENPIAISAGLTKSDQFVRYRIYEILSLEDAKKKKFTSYKKAPKTQVQSTQSEKTPQQFCENFAPIKVKLNANNQILLDKIYQIARTNTGNYPLELHIALGEKNVLINSSLKVSDTFKTELSNIKRAI